MSFGENLQFLRKKNNITQEQLAEKLGVSRQSVSKWESDGSYPEMDKLMQLCEMFSCNMDSLMRGNVEENVMEDTAHYDAHMNDFSKWIAGAVGLVLFNIGLQSLLEVIGIGDEFCSLIFWVTMSIPTIIFIVKGLQHDSFKKKNPSISQFYTGDIIEQFERKFVWLMAVPIGMIILNLACQPLLEKALLSGGYSDEICGVVFFWILAVAVPILVYGGLQKSKYNVEEYNDENEYNKEVNPETQAVRRKIGKWCAVIMLVATILFLLSIGVEISDYMGAKQEDVPFLWKTSILAYSWLVFPVGGILCGIVAVIFQQPKSKIETPKEQ